MAAIVAVATVWYASLVRGPLFDAPYSRVLYASDGGELLGARVADDGQWRFPPTELLSPRYVKALIEFEDRRFRRHAGVSIPSLVRASIQNISQERVVSGASTITMQVIRLSRGNPPRTLSEKMFEMVAATRLEWSYTKDEILALYAAHAPFGGNIVGVEAAAWRYFGRSPAELSWAEAATLAVLPNSPALIHPGHSADALLSKRNRLLLKMLRSRTIDSTEYRLALDEPLPKAPAPLPRHAPQLVDRLPRSQSFTSTIDKALQIRVQQLVDNYGKNILIPNRIGNAAALVAEIETGRVIAYVGNLTPDGATTAASDGRSVDIITSRRSTGSLLKPLLYAAMIADGQIMPQTLVLDTPLNISGFTPSNYNRSFSGVVSARAAIEQSLNVPVVRMLSRYNTSRFLGLLRALGMTTLDHSADHYGATLILGGAEGTLWDMTGMYASLARALQSYSKEGTYRDDDLRGLSLGDAQPPRKIESNALSRMDPAALWYMFEAMSGVNRPEEEAAWQEFSSMKQVAWKTGTSYGNRDAWAVGLTPRYIVGVWVGNADGRGQAAMTGVGSAAPIMFDIFSMLPAAERWFDRPLGCMEPMAVCRRSGHRASQWCYAAVDSGSAADGVDTVDMPKAGLSTPLCPYHYPVATDRGVVGWFVLPPAAEYFHRRRGGDYAAVPPSSNMALGSPLELIYPEHEAVLYLPRGFDGDEQFVFRAAHRGDTATIYWSIDDNYLGATRSDMPDGHRIGVSATAGVHILTVVDDAGNRRKIRFTVRSTTQAEE